jgi:Cu(I)/Ag(I) efflux system membrane protein CusA/SilA
MLTGIIGWSVRNRVLVLLATVGAIAAGVWAAMHTPLEALPDLSDVQVIVQAEYGEQRKC